jgi:hypothetical protein
MDLDFLRPLYEQVGGVVSVYLDTSRGNEEGVRQVELRWRDARARLADQGADEASLDAVAAAITPAAMAAPGRAVFARGGRVLLTEALPAAPRREITRLAVLPHVMPLLAQRSPHIAHLRVTARHDGGEVLAVRASGAEYAEEVTGTGWPVHKTGLGGWATKRYENSTEEAWELNAKELAAQVTAMAGQVGAGLILLAGDPQARTLLLRQLSHDLAAATVTLDEEITADSPAAAQAAGRAVAEQVAQRSRERFEHWRTQQAHQRGVAGLPATMAALRDGAVAEVLIADHPESAATAWIGPGATDLAAAAADLAARGVHDPVTERADAAIVRALAMTGAQLYFLPDQGPGEPGPDDLRQRRDDGPAAGRSDAGPPPEGGICALLRYPADAVG